MDYLGVYQSLAAVYGAQNWWPIYRDGASHYLAEYHARPRTPDEAFEIAIGAILTQNTAWTNVERALHNLKAAGLLSAKALEGATDAEIALSIKPSGYFNQKTKKIRAFLTLIRERLKGSLANLAAYPWVEGREMLLSVWGIGRETADSIMLYSFDKPVFVVDAYTRRILSRLGLLDALAGYDSIRLILEDALPEDVFLYKEYHALLVRHAVTRCKKSPACPACFLSNLCPFAKRRTPLAQ